MRFSEHIYRRSSAFIGGSERFRGCETSFTVFATILGSLTFWSAMAFATVWAFLVVRARNRRQRDQWKDEDRAWGHDPDEDDDPPNDADIP